MIVQFLAEAMRVLRENKARSLLTLTGLIIGVMAVIAIQVLGSGMAGAVGGVLGNLNDQTFTVFPNFRQANFRRASLSLRDLPKIAQADPNVREVYPAGGIAQRARLGHQRPMLLLYPESSNRFITAPIRFGRAFDATDITDSAQVCVLTAEGYRKLVPGGGDPTGQSVRAGERRYVIVGVMGELATGILAQGLRGADVALPYTTFEREYLRDRPMFAVRVLVKDVGQMADTEVAVVRTLREIHKGSVTYQTFDRKTVSQGINGIFGAVTFIVGIIGAVSLLVAGIGILNIMLVSVAERTREIGLRKAIGATRFAISLQFFIEALLLSTFGCAIGLVFGLLIGGLVNRFALVALSGVVAPIPWLQATLIATSFATIVTLLFGTYPAYRASRLDPIEALRYE